MGGAQAAACPSRSARKSTRLHLFFFGFSIVISACKAPPNKTSAVHSVDRTLYEKSLVVPNLSNVWCAEASPSPHCEWPVAEAAMSVLGRTFVLERGQLAELTKDSGKLVRLRSGSGPLELQGPMSFGVSKRGVLIYDIRKMTAIDFGLGSKSEEYRAVPPAFMQFIRIRNGRLVALVIPPADAIGDSVTASIVMFSQRDSSWSETIATFRERANAVGNGTTRPVNLPWSRRVLWDVCGDGTAVVGSTEKWEVRRLRKSETVYLAERTGIPNDPMTKTEHDSLVAGVLRTAPALPGFLEPLKKLLSPIPASRPALQELWCDDAGRVLIRNSTRYGSQLSRIDVLSAAGDFEYSMSIPGDVRLMQFYKDELFGLRDVDQGSELLKIHR